MEPQINDSLVDVSNLSADTVVEILVNNAVALNASDLFFVSNATHVAVNIRHLGLIRPLSTIPIETGRRCLSHIKAMAQMDTNERRRPADGRWIYRRNDDAGDVDLRINVIPTLFGEDFAMRLMVRSRALLRLESLGMLPEQRADYLSSVANPGGLVLITGPTGSGKTSTLYATLMHLNTGQRKINTIEDPIEYGIEGMRQSQVNNATGLGFSELLKGVLRQSPDVIMIGEIRDEETARTAVYAANSGILVFATLHAPAAANAVQSMINLGAHPHFLAAGLRCVVGQRLVRTLCPNCREAFSLDEAPHTFDDVRKWLGPDEGRTLHIARGCDNCGKTGYAGRTGVFEVMVVNRDLRQMITETRPVRELAEAAIACGMIPMGRAAMLQVARGITSTEEIFRTVPSEQVLAME